MTARLLELFRRLRYFLRRDALARELDEEMRHHLALKAEAQGRASAHRQFGNTTLYQEQSRAMWTFAILDQFRQDIRYAFRTMAASPLFTAAAVLSLALGIGANTAIYSFMDAILLRSLPVRNPERLVILHWRASERTPVIHSTMGTMRRDGEHGRTSPNFPYAAWEALRLNSGPVMELMAYSTYDQLNLVIKGQAETAHASFVSGDFYDMLGVVPAYGRMIGPDDDRVGAPPVAVISYDYFERRFASDPAAVGQTILVNNQPVTLAGVSAPGFFGVDPEQRPVILMPLRLKAQFSDRVQANEQRLFFDPHVYWVEMMARLRPGVSLAQAQAALGHQFREFVLSTAASEKERAPLPELWLEPGASGLDSLRHEYSKPLYVLITMVALILTIACANIANLLLARSAARRREVAVRLSLGAGRARIVRQLLTESMALSLVGGALGVLVAFWGIRFITWVIANGRQDFTLHAELNWPVLGFTLALALAAGMLFGLAPALQSTKVNLSPALKAGTGAAAAGRRWQVLSLPRILVCVQIGMSLMLVFGASLFVRTIANLHSIDVGFNRENILLFSINARQGGYQNEALARFMPISRRASARCRACAERECRTFHWLPNTWIPTPFPSQECPRSIRGTAKWTS